jgi:hypothetical protein
MNLTSITPRPDHSEKRVFECPKCSFIDTRVAIAPATASTDQPLDR